jgi:hypothetical protein
VPVSASPLGCAGSRSSEDRRPATRQLRKGDSPQRLEPQAFELLDLLIARRPAAVSKQEIRDRLWPDTFDDGRRRSVRVSVANIDTGNNGGSMATTSIAAVAEFKILTNACQAEYGRAVGGQVQVVTRSGTQAVGLKESRRAAYCARCTGTRRDSVQDLLGLRRAGGCLERRHVAGAVPKAFLNARENAASDS